jgi:hypothetical protein
MTDAAGARATDQREPLAAIPVNADETLFAQIARWKDNLLDWDAKVDECRADLHAAAIAFVYGHADADARFDAATDALEDAGRHRDRAAAHLAHLIDLARQTTVTT